MEGVENARDRPDKEEMPPNPVVPERMNFKLKLKQGGSRGATSYVELSCYPRSRTAHVASTRLNGTRPALAHLREQL